MKTHRERAEERRSEKLALIEQQIASGDLTVRKMTPKEAAANPPRPRPEHGRGRKRR